MLSPDFVENFEAFAKKMTAHVREKAAKAGSNIVYLEGEELVEENPATGERHLFAKTVRLPA